MTSPSRVEYLIQQVPQTTARTQPFYCDGELFALDMQKIANRQWLLIDHVSRIPEVGDYFLYEVGKESIIVIRDENRDVHALFNVCRHRGSLVCLEKEGQRKRLTCPYHAWSYGLDGALKSARYMPEDFSPQEHGLKKCHLRVHHGLIFLNLSEGEEPDFDEEYAVFEPHLAFHGFSKAKIAHRRSYPTDANWKLVVENFFECYHCAPSHPEYCSRHIRDALVAVGAGPNSGPVEEVERFEPQLKQWEARAAALGRPMGSVDDDEQSPHMKFYQQRPHRTDIESETRDGKPVANLMGARTECDHGRMHMSFSPFNQLIACNDFAALVVFSPRSALFTDVEVIWLVDEGAEAVDIDRLTWMWDVTTLQDKVITENNQRGILSARYEPGCLSDQERRVATFNKWYVRQLSA